MSRPYIAKSDNLSYVNSQRMQWDLDLDSDSRVDILSCFKSISLVKAVVVFLEFEIGTSISS